MSRSPNAEQKLAIEHFGGVILSAGAGSGKTFVLVEHIVFLTNKWIEEYKISKQGTFEEYIRNKFSEVVMMTFTKKAAGEMSIRLTDRFADLSNSENDHEYWQIANEVINSLMVTTIDGFCRKLITSGYFPNLSTEAKIITSSERREQVCRLADEWFDLYEATLNENIFEIILKEKNKILDGFCKIFDDPALRIEWRKFDDSYCDLSSVSRILTQSCDLNQFELTLEFFSNLNLPSTEKERSPFEEMMFKLSALGTNRVDSFDRLNDFYKILTSGQLRGQTGKKQCPEYDEAHKLRANFAKWIKNWHEVIEPYVGSFEDKIRPWVQSITTIFHYIDKRLDPNQGMTFGDLAYFVTDGLDNRDILERVLKQFRYYIVDEFQDTSKLQFSITDKLLNNNYKNLFCVGDPKQAIYGFRGGSLDVFYKAENLLKNESLANNYRSLPTVINFNNSLFNFLFPLGWEYQGHDPFTVDFRPQTLPTEVSFKDQGTIEVLQMKIEAPEDVEKFKISTGDINKIEANLILEDLKIQRNQFPEEVCTILYSKLGPSNELIKILMKNEIGFSAQYKIDLLEEPIVGFFLILLKRHFDTKNETKNRFPISMLEAYLKMLHIDEKVSEEQLNEFDLSTEYWGLLEAFRRFLFNLGITHENSDLNLDLVETICALYEENIEAILAQLTQGLSEKVSLELRYGTNSDKVRIMTSHASKGLEFDVVYLGGVYVNGKIESETTILGKHGGSFVWYQDLSQKDYFDSPMLHFEKEKSKLLEFSEFKRLFYVACTRAQKKLKFINLDYGSAFSAPKNSWSRALDLWLLSSEVVTFQETLIFKPSSLKASEILGVDSSTKLPFFFYDPMGIHKKGGQNAEFMLASELSVTRLNSLVDCPRKFYLQNILKLKPTSEDLPKIVFEESEVEEIAQGISSSERGTHIHAQISLGLSRNFVVPLESFNTEARKPLEWILNELKPLSENYDLISEKSIKFPFFNYMISGIPDLILMSKSDSCSQVWDFKTGKMTEKNLEHYWLQLQTYAYALYVLEKVSLSSKIILKLAFVDEQKFVSKEVDFNGVKESLFPIWSAQKHPWKINPEHCAQCIYGDICPR